MKKGFSLIEVMMAILMLAVGILAWAGLQDNNIEGRSKSGRMTTAFELAQSLLEDKAAEVSGWTDSYSGNFTDSMNSTVDNVLYQLQWNVEKDTNGTIDFLGSGGAFWKLSVENRWDHFGQHRVAYERVVMGK